MRWWDISAGKLVKPYSPEFEHWGVCKIIERATNGVLLVEEIDHTPSKRIPKRGARVRHFINAGKLKVVESKDATQEMPEV